MKKLIIAGALIGAGVCGTIKSISANTMPVTVSKEQIIQETTVSAEEIKQLQEMGIDYNDLVETARDRNNDLFDDPMTFDKNNRFIFFSDGAMESGPIDGEGSYIADGITGLVLARYNPATDPNAVDFKTAKELNELRDIRYYVDYHLGNLKDN